ncbi:type VI secretion system baseplate subunit TssF [Phreatobacter stygius]|uniref:Type VI secretion system baseplate subunit TssF n=1 Tax=Phreatobacter stygius TaxID=1940610 RepID=A0A4D7AZ26_9HYPH|nr:type VI secretion system baseplate subunit TssF [Phreatobacter stygius]QCI64043.1 type VI secretion system baseplate subunit TssF [Phreatobacter stygius]
MNREFLDLYNRELLLLYEQAKEFSEEYPDIAQRLGGLAGERTDPMVSGLLEGCAFLAARVQLKMKHEFPEFTGNLLEQLLPNALAPIASTALVQVRPRFGDPALREGRLIEAGEAMDAVHVERDRQVACRFRLSQGVTLWPFEIARAHYFGAPAPLQSMGIPIDRSVAAGLVLSLRHRSVADAAEEPDDAAALAEPLGLFAGCRVDRLPFHILGAEADAIGLYEQLFARRLSIHVRFLDEFGDPVVIRAPGVALRQLGFGDDEQLFPDDKRVFRGFELLREFFVLPRKFIGFELTGLASVMPKLKAKTVDVVFTFDEVNPRLAAFVKPEAFALYTAPAINLFEKTTDRLPVKTGLHEYNVVPDRGRPLDYEPHRIISVHAHRLGGRDKIAVPPLYGASLEGVPGADRLAYAVRRLPRRRTATERRYGTASDYVGTDMYLAITSPLGSSEEDRFVELSVRALCSNRHLPELLPVGSGGADFRLLNDTELEVACVAGPTRPREPVVSQRRGRTETWSTGATVWRLLNLLSLNHLGLIQDKAGGDARMLKETLFIFADITDGSAERRIWGIRSVVSRPIVRRVQRRDGASVARGLEITVSFDEKAFEGSGIFLIGAVLDRFFAEYSHLNQFTQTVVRSTERGEIMRWPPRMGLRRQL